MYGKREIDILKKQVIGTFEEAVEYLFGIPRFTGKNSMEDTRAFLHRLGDPDRNMKIIHVAGTNGKGSVCAYLRSILETAGFTVSVFTSPHLVDVRERFLIRGEMVEKEEFLKAFLRIYEMLEWNELEEGRGYHPSFFEYMFFIGMVLFSGTPADYCILETGLGGRLDATNAVSRKELSVITRIGLDHMEYLGNTLAEIAEEKAGIIHSGAPVVFWDTEESVRDVFCKRARELGVSAYAVSKKDYSFLDFQNKSIDFCLHTRYYDYIRRTLHTQARYQMENASLAVKAIEILDGGAHISKEQIARGVEKSFWQGRMEEVLPEVYVDGAHNGDGIRAFVETVSGDGWQGKRSLLFGVVKDKDYACMLDQLLVSGLFERVVFAPLRTGRRLDVATIQDTMKNITETRHIRIPYECFANVEEAFRTLTNHRKPDERIYVAGSLYLVGEVKEVVDTLRSVEKNHD